MTPKHNPNNKECEKDKVNTTKNGGFLSPCTCKCSECQHEEGHSQSCSKYVDDPLYLGEEGCHPPDERTQTEGGKHDHLPTESCGCPKGSIVHGSSCKEFLPKCAKHHASPATEGEKSVTVKWHEKGCMGIPCTCPSPATEGEMLYCDRQDGSKGKNCKCICHQEDYPLPKDFPSPADTEGWENDETYKKYIGEPRQFPQEGVIVVDIEVAREVIHREREKAFDEGLQDSNYDALTQREDEILQEAEKLKWNLSERSDLPAQAHHEASIRNTALSDLQTIIKKRTI